MSRRAMPNADAAWLHMDRPSNRAIINAVLWFDTPVDLESLRESLRKRLVDRFPTFRCLAVERGSVGGVDWEEDPDFDLDLHVHHVALPAPGDRIALQALVGDLASTPLHRDKPLWDAYLIDGYGTGSALLLRIHHCIGDGIALTRVLMSMTDDQRRGPRPRPRRRRDTHPTPLLGAIEPLARAGLAVAEGVARGGVRMIGHPRRAASDAVSDVRALGHLLFASFDPQTAIRGDLGAAERVAWGPPCALADVKAIAHANDATVNDVLVSAVAGALGRYLRDEHTAVDEIRAMVPFNLRPLDEAVEPELGNHFGLVLLGLPVALTDPLERLRVVHERMDALKHSREGAVTYALLEAMGSAPVAVEDLAIAFFSSKSSLVLTNVPGPGEPVYVARARVDGILVWAPCAGTVSTSVSVFSYAGAVSVGFLVDAGLVPDPNTLVAHVADELAALSAVP